MSYGSTSALAADEQVDSRVQAPVASLVDDYTSAAVDNNNNAAGNDSDDDDDALFGNNDDGDDLSNPSSPPPREHQQQQRGGGSYGSKSPSHQRVTKASPSPLSTVASAAGDDPNTLSMSSTFWTATLPLVQSRQQQYRNSTPSTQQHNQTIGHHVGGGRQVTIHDRHDDLPFGNDDATNYYNSVMPAEAAAAGGTAAYMARTVHIFELQEIASRIAAFMGSPDLILHFRCLHVVCCGAAEAELRSRIVQRTIDNDFFHDQAAQPSGSYTSLHGANSSGTSNVSSLKDSIITVTLKDQGGIRVICAPKAKSLFVEEPQQSYKRRQCGLIWGTLIGQLARELVTLPHRRRSDRPLDNFLSASFESSATTTNAASAMGGGPSVQDPSTGGVPTATGAQFPMRSQHELSRVTMLRGWWHPMPKNLDQNDANGGKLTISASHIYFSPQQQQRSSKSASSSSTAAIIKRKLKQFTSVSEAEAKASYTAIHRARTQFPLLFDVTVSFLRAPIQLRVSQFVPSTPDLSMLVRLPTDPSRSMMRKASGVTVCCNVSVIANDASLASWVYETVPVLSPFASTTSGRKKSASMSGTMLSVLSTAAKGLPVVQGHTATTYLHLTKPIPATAVSSSVSSRKLSNAVPRTSLAPPEWTAAGKMNNSSTTDSAAAAAATHQHTKQQEAAIILPLSATMPQTVTLHVFLDGLAQPIGELHNISLSMRLSELRSIMETRLRWMVTMMDNCIFRVFRHLNTNTNSMGATTGGMTGNHAGSAAASLRGKNNASYFNSTNPASMTPRSNASGGAAAATGGFFGGPQSRRSSARSQRHGSIATLTNVQIGGDSDCNEDDQLVVDALPPVRGQFLRQMLEGYEPSFCGWMGGEVRALMDCMLCVVIAPRPSTFSNAAANSAASLLNSTATSGAMGPELQSAAAARVRHLRAQKAKDALKDIHPALQLYFIAQGAALDACRRGDTLVLQQVLDGAVNPSSSTSNGVSSIVSPTLVKGALSPSAAGGSRLPLDMPPVVPTDKTTSILMHTAAENGRKLVLELLISRGFPVDERDSDGQYPLHRAATKGHAECIPMLLRAANGHAALNAPDARGRTPLHLALENNMLNTALWLVEQGANADARDAAGRSAADVACRKMDDLFSHCRSGDVDAVRVLLQGALPISPAILSSDGDSAQWYMCALKHRLTRGRLLFGLRNQYCIHPRHGSAVENIVKTSALHTAVVCGHVPIVRLLLSEPSFRNLVDVSETTSCGDSLLHLAARSANRLMFSTVLDSIESETEMFTLSPTDNAVAVGEGSTASQQLRNGPIASLSARNASGDTVLHTCLKSASPAAAASVLVHLLTRCQQAPQQYPLEEFGALVSNVRDAQGLTVCHAAVSRAASLPDGVLQALLAAALSASSSWKPQSPPLRKPGGVNVPLSEYFLARFPNKEHSQPSRLKDDFGSLRPKSLFHIAVCRGNTTALQLLVDFMAHCVQQQITWLVSDFGALSSLGLLNAAYLRDDGAMFLKLLQLQAKLLALEGLAPFALLDVTTTQYRRTEEEETDKHGHKITTPGVECIEIPVAWRIISDARSAQWVDLVLSSPHLVSSLRSADKAMFEFNSVNGAEAAISMISLVVDEIVSASEERERRRLPSRPPPPVPKHSTWGQFLAKPRDPTREEREQQLSSEERHADHRLSPAEREGVLLYALRQLLMCMNPRSMINATAAEAHLFSRRVLYAAIRCRGHAGAFSILQTAFDGTHVFSHEDLVRSTNLGVQFGLTPSAGVVFQELRADGRMFTPGSSMKATRSGGGTGGGTQGGDGLNTRGSLMSRGSTTRPNTKTGRSHASTGAAHHNDDGMFGVVETNMGSLFAQDDPHRFEQRMRERESQLCHIIPHIAAVAPGAFLHDLCSRRMFGAAMTLLVTATANAHAAVHLNSPQRAGRSRSQDKERRHRSSSPPAFALPMTLRQDNVNLRCPELERLTGVTALHMAAQFGVTQLLAGLLRTGQFHPQEPSDARHWTPMHWASRYGHLETCRALLSIGVTPTDVSDPSGSGSVLGTTPLHLAAVSGSTELVAALLEHCAAVDARSLMGRTPLHLACRKGHVDVTLALIDAGANVDREDEDGNTPLLLAAQEGHGQLVSRVITHVRRDALLLTINSRTQTSFAHFCSWLGGADMNQLLTRVLQQSTIPRPLSALPSGSTSIALVTTGATSSSMLNKPTMFNGSAIVSPSMPSIPPAPLRPPTNVTSAAAARGGEGRGGGGALHGGRSASIDTTAWLESNQSFVAKHFDNDNADFSTAGGAMAALDAILTAPGSAPFLESALSGVPDVVSVQTSRSSTAPASPTKGGGHGSAHAGALRCFGLPVPPPARGSTTATTTSAQKRRFGVDAVLASSGHRRAVVNHNVGPTPMRTVPPTDSTSTVTPPRGGALDIMQQLVDATERRRVALLDAELCRHTQRAAQVCKNHPATAAGSLLVLPESFTIVRKSTLLEKEPIALHADQRGQHAWLPLHYAVANGQKDATRILRDHLGAALPRVPEILLDRHEEARAAAERRAVIERRRSEASLRILFPPVVCPHNFPAHIASSAKALQLEVFEPLPPPPPSPRLWHDGYYGTTTAEFEGLVGLFHRVSAPSLEEGHHATANKSSSSSSTFKLVSRRRITQSLAWQLRHKLCTELYRYLPLLDSVDEPIDDAQSQGVTLLMLAAHYDNTEAIDILVEYGADVNARSLIRDKNPMTFTTLPPKNLEESNDVDAAGSGSDAEEDDDHDRASSRSPGKHHHTRHAHKEVPIGVTPIVVACAAGCLASVHRLIEHGADPDVSDECGNTPVHHAVLRKDFPMVKTLLHAGAQIHVVNHAGDTPEDIAVALRTHSIIRMLRWWTMTFRIMPSHLVPMREPCHTELTYADWIEKTATFYKRLDLLHDGGHMLANKIEQDSVPALMYIRLCQRLKVVATPSLVSLLVPHWWPEDVRVVRLPGVFLEEHSLVAVFTFVKLLTHMLQFDLCDAKLTDAAVPPLCTAFVEHPAVRRINLSGNRGIGRKGGLQLLELVQTNKNIVGLDLSATGVEAPLNALIQRQVEANMIEQSLDVDDPTKPPPKPVTHKPYHLPRISALV
ncbi:ankyrin repeat protein, putative [Bodo saltans]|uniref:Ankyrin repeat protein, putative n=1 Tax=Bodo saltans TaxID=75058 RepID=A0A0S4JDN4_BODSA|nr:ankyrin repeat protein, putative [Bodo saltans]|eukprot:CUG87291.1 ankyrin repeat protein, putative [Bodo saltans]